MFGEKVLTYCLCQTVVKHFVLYSKGSKKALIPFKPRSNMIKYSYISCVGFLPSPLLLILRISYRDTFPIWNSVCGCPWEIWCICLICACSLLSFLFSSFLSSLSPLLGVSVTLIGICRYCLTPLVVPSVLSSLYVFHVERWSFSSLK